MRALLRLFSKMNVILYASFLLYSVLFILLISGIDNYNWQQMFTNFQREDLQRNAYLIMDDMRSEGIAAGPLTEEQRGWLQRRAAMYGVVLHFENSGRQEVWFDSFAKANHPLSGAIEVPFMTAGKLQGYLRMDSILDKTELEPAYVEFKKSIDFRSRLLFIAILCASTVFSFFIAKKLTKRLNNVYALASEIRSGNRNIEIPVKGPAEIRRLAATLNEMTKELKKQEDWRHHLMEDLTHELRTPLTSLLTQIEAIVDGLFEPDPKRMQDIYEELIRLSRLVNDLERLSEAESARFSLNIKRTNMVQLANTVYTNFIPVARGKNIKLIFEPAYVPCYAEVDRDKIVQVLSNIVLNAIKYTSEGGKVHIGVSWSPDCTIISCEDNGIGISETDMPYIFNRLYRADKSRSRFSGGVGLGLSIAKELVEAHKGTIGVTSALGRGSRFTVTIPNEYARYTEANG